MLYQFPAFVCFIVFLALLLGFLLGGRWQREAYDAVWRDGAHAAIAYICAGYDRVPRKLSKLLTIAALELQASGQLEIERERYTVTDAGIAAHSGAYAKQEGGVEE